MKVILRGDSLDVNKELTDFQNKYLKKGSYGGVVTFIGTMRDFNDGFSVSTMYLDHYPGMTEKHIEAVCQEAHDKWDIMESLVVHRYGEIKPSEDIVLVAVWSAHRAEAFDACRYIINYLKERAPFWKREATPQGDRWVEHNSVDPGVVSEPRKIKTA